MKHKLNINFHMVFINGTNCILYTTYFVLRKFSWKYNVSVSLFTELHNCLQSHKLALVQEEHDFWRIIYNIYQYNKLYIIHHKLF